MKNQYFGDINDYRKYGLLRILADGGKLRIGVCWMLTDDDASGHGKSVRYLEQPRRWEGCDADLFNRLERYVPGNRNVSRAESANLIPSAVYYDELLTATPDTRLRYFEEMFEKFKETDLVFFDPDNGMEVRSVKLGHKESPKYLFWEELCSAFARGHSVLVYQHFPRENRERFIERIADEIRKRSGAKEMHTFRTSNVVFLLAPQEKHQKVFRELAKRVEGKWGQRIRVNCIPFESRIRA